MELTQQPSQRNPMMSQLHQQQLERLGHASERETLDNYSHLWPDDEDRTRAALAWGALSQATPKVWCVGL
jgi:hypothetical protein